MHILLYKDVSISLVKIWSDVSVIRVGLSIKHFIEDVTRFSAYIQMFLFARDLY